MLTVKQMLLGSFPGRALLSVRDLAEMLYLISCRREQVGTFFNNRLATLLVTRICRPRKCFVDVGAHLGTIVSAVIEHDSSIKVIAIEAEPEKAVRLQQKFPTAEVHGCAAGDYVGEASFFVNTKKSGESTLLRPANCKMLNIVEIKVPATTLDDIVSSNEIDVIKIDVEGAEPGVLRGASNLLEKNRPTIMFESVVAGRDAEQTKALWRQLTEKNYDIFIPNRVAHEGIGLGEEGFVESHVYPRRTNDYFAIPKERRIEIRDRARSILKIHATIDE